MCNFVGMNEEKHLAESGGDASAPQAALYLFPVPLSDSSKLASVLPSVNAELLRGIRHFIVENVRSARRFIKRVDASIDVNEMQFSVLDEHTRPEDVAAMLAPLEAGNPMGVISEAGCPAVADPGADAVAVAQRRGLRVVPLVGPSSILLALMGSGFNGQSFAAFAGYLPIETSKGTAKLREMVNRIRHERQTQIFIETPYRNNRLIEELVSTLPGDLLLCVASDITGSRESIITRPLQPVGKGYLRLCQDPHYLPPLWLKDITDIRELLKI